MQRVADYIVQRLYKENVNHIFMVSGRGALFLTDAVAANKGVQGISLHHEQSAAYAAVAYANYSGEMGACMVSTGCAGTNTLTGVLNAWQDGIPCIFISGNNKLEETSNYTGIPLRTYGQQEADIIPIVESITKYAVMISDPKTIVYELEKAIYLAKEGRKGPVWVDIPLDVQNMRIREEELKTFIPPTVKSLEPKSEEVDFVLTQIELSKRPLVLIGSGIKAAKAEKVLANFVENSNIPLVYSGSAPDVYGMENDLCVGSVGIMGCTRAGNFTMQNADLILVLGNRLSSMVTGPETCKFARDAKIIVVDIDEVEHSKFESKIDKLIFADVGHFLKSLIQSNVKNNNDQWNDKCSHWKDIFPICEGDFKSKNKVDLYQLADALSENLPQQASLMTDSGMIELIMPNNVSFKKGQRAIHPASQGSMGFALPAMIGSYYASQKPVISVIGDGSIMMNIQELATIAYKKIPAKILVVNNNVYAVIRKRQEELFRGRTIGNDPSDGVGVPEFEKLATGFDIPYYRINNVDSLNKGLQEVFEMEGSVLCEIIGLEHQDYIAMGHTRTKEKKFVARPLEDQRPYLDRDLFLSEMVIEPIDQ